MSDLQIQTGISILISGFLQLNCGISSYHWQMIVYLTWFASLTNLGCLTFLRGYLYRHPVERTCRLLGMGCIVIMLTVALVPTVNFAWLEQLYSSQYDYLPNWEVKYGMYNHAICHFVIEPNVATEHAKLNVGLSITLLVVAYICRVVLVHNYLSRALIGKWRTWASQHARALLLALWEKWEVQTKPNTFKRRLVYHPLLACFLSARILLDLIASMALEVSVFINR